MTIVPTQTPTYDVLVDDFVYSRQADFDWKIRVFRPDGVGPFPTMLQIYGGAWTRGDRTRNTVLCEALASRGVVVAAPDLHAPPVGVYPSAMRDVNVAARWLKANAARFGGVSSIGGIGTSTGGHQAVLCAMRPTFEAYADLPAEGDADAGLDYVIAVWPVIDPLARFDLVIEQNNEDYIWAHKAFWLGRENMAQGSPQVLIDQGAEVRTPPILIIQRDVDKLHPLEMAEKFAASYQGIGGDTQLIVIPGLSPMFRMDEPGQELLDAALPFAHQHTK